MHREAVLERPGCRSGGPIKVGRQKWATVVKEMASAGPTRWLGRDGTAGHARRSGATRPVQGWPRKETLVLACDRGQSGGTVGRQSLHETGEVGSRRGRSWGSTCWRKAPAEARELAQGVCWEVTGALLKEPAR